jgi:hypothetical protein
MNHKELRNKFLSNFDKELVVDRLTPHLSGLIDESIEAVMEGRDSIEGRKPSSEEEIMQVLYHGVTTRLGVYQGVIDAAKKLSNKDTVVTINYRGEPSSFGGI